MSDHHRKKKKSSLLGYATYSGAFAIPKSRMGQEQNGALRNYMVSDNVQPPTL